MFQIGKLLTQSMIAGFGTASIAANACAMTVEQLAFMPGSAMGLAMTTVVGQCVRQEIISRREAIQRS